MATIRPFNALRYTDNDLNSVVCPPYDIVSETQREEYINNNEHNIIRLELPLGENRYKKAGELLHKWVSEGTLKQDDKAGIYVYEMQFSVNGEVKSVKGFVSLVKLEDFSKGIILPHEETLSKAKEDRFNLMSETFCNFSQIYSLYMDDDNKSYTVIDACSKGSPDMEVTDSDGTVHRMWCIYDEKVINNLQHIFENKKLYIADGHHRYETALNFHNSLKEKGISDDNSLSGYISMMLVNMENPGLVVFPTHRIIRGLKDFDINSVLEKCSDYFDVTLHNDISTIEKNLNKCYTDGKKTFALYYGDKQWALLELKNNDEVKKFLPEKSNAYCQLDVSVLHTLILERIFNIDKQNMANQVNLTYTKIFDEAIEYVDSGKADCSFILNPTRVTEIRDVALASEKMPQKSTYFYPKLITGLVINKFM